MRHDRSIECGSDKWEEPTTVINEQPILTLEVLENRLKEELAIFPTPDCNPCYSLDEFNYPAVPQWYLKAVSIYNKRMGQRGRGSMAWRGGPNSDCYLSDNVGYQYVPPIRPTPLFDRDEPITVPSFGMPMATIVRPTMNITGPSLNNLGPSARPIAVRPPNFSNMGPLPVPNFNNTRPFPINTMPILPSVTSESSNISMIPTTPSVNTNTITTQQVTPLTISNIPLPSHDKQQTDEDGTKTDPKPLFEPELFDSFPKIGEINSPPLKELVTGKTNDGDLTIEDNGSNNNISTFDEVSPSPLSLVNEDNIIKPPSLTVSTVYTQSFNKKGRQNGSRGRTMNKRGTRHSPKSLIVSFDLIKVKLRPQESIEAATEEEFNYDDYLDQLNNEEEDDKPSVFDSCYWIDKNPQSNNGRSDSKENSSTEQTMVDNPLDEDFPAVDENMGTKGKVTLRALVSDGSVDKSVKEGQVRISIVHVYVYRKSGNFRHVGNYSLVQHVHRKRKFNTKNSMKHFCQNKK